MMDLCPSKMWCVVRSLRFEKRFLSLKNERGKYIQSALQPVQQKQQS